ncbi:hypothetical protein EGR_07863 [Echinococcus granulosus]|uniref:Uncharacterized protein n=1 Tax=Echinococcus granulosus TaxID=6210 RepID=W6U7P8_ECHGR|nr:hypothetical protein EGR_07863 [Echinococcus granulosus]EUB57253.1 hypothetical protein EGR_07863 [Echinococcus granulosus]
MYQIQSKASSDAGCAECSDLLATFMQIILQRLTAYAGGQMKTAPPSKPAIYNDFTDYLT